MDTITKAATPATVSVSKLVDMDTIAKTATPATMDADKGRQGLLLQRGGRQGLLPQHGNHEVLNLIKTNKYDISDDVSPLPTTNAENARLLLLVSALRKENIVAHQLLESYRLLLGTTGRVMGRRLPLKATRGRLINTCDKATIEVMVAELDKLERIYSPHMAPAGNDERVRGSLCAQADIPGPEEERGCTSGSLPVKADVPRPEEERGRNDGPLRVAEVDVLRPGQERGHTNGSPYPAVDWDNIARLSASRGSISLTLPHPIGLPVHACEPGPLLATSWDDIKLKSRTYNPMGGKYTPPSSSHPFGQIDGFRTNLGPISFPKGPVKGHILEPFHDDEGLLKHRWVLHATPPGVRRRGARGLRR